MDDDLRLLASVPLFAGLDRDQLGRLADRSPARTLAAGDVLVRQGDPADRLIVVGAGALGSSYDTAQGLRLRLGEFNGPCVVDKTAVLDGRGYTATWSAATRARVFLLAGNDFRMLLDTVPALRRHVLHWLADQLRDQQDRLVGVHFTSTTTRTAAWLTRTAAGTATRVALPGAQQGLAEILGVSRVTVNRALRTLAREGLIRIEPAAVVIVAPEQLARRGDG
jgi:CRP/FNR family transcriptional regulator, cyclic AMP receptor protein